MTMMLTNSIAVTQATRHQLLPRATPPTGPSALAQEHPQLGRRLVGLQQFSILHQRPMTVLRLPH